MSTLAKYEMTARDREDCELKMWECPHEKRAKVKKWGSHRDLPCSKEECLPKMEAYGWGSYRDLKYALEEMLLAAIFDDPIWRPVLEKIKTKETKQEKAIKGTSKTRRHPTKEDVKRRIRSEAHKMGETLVKRFSKVAL